MKNWFEQFEGRIFSGQATITKAEFEQIQLAAWKDGMRKAMNIIMNGDSRDHLNNIEECVTLTNTLYPREDV